jgi:thymidylate synthase (FAD)
MEDKTALLSTDLLDTSNCYVGKIELLDSMGSDLDVVNAARVSFDVQHTSMEKRDIDLVKYLWDHKHSTPFEHCIMKFRIEVPMYIAKQHMRHRTWSYNEVSRRYTSHDIKIYEPIEFRAQSSNNRQASTSSTLNPVIESIDGQTSSYVRKASDELKALNRKAIKLYNNMLEAGICREQARGVLPQNTFTSYIATANLLNVLKFLGLRNKPEAQYEMQLLAKAMEDMVKECFPVVYKAYKNELA